MRKQRRRKKSQEHVSHERWLVSYADFITLLFAFFVVLYATSSANETKQEEFEKSVKKYLLGAANGGVSGEAGGKSSGPHKKHDSLIAPPIKKFNKNSKKTAELQQSIERYLQESMPSKQVTKYINDVRSDTTGVRIILDANKIYSSNSSLFTASGVQFVNLIKDLIESMKQQVIVENHMASNAKSGNYKTLWELTAVRSTSFVRYLNKSNAAKDLVPIGYGSSRPMLPSRSDSKNTRIELYFPETSI